MKKAAVISLSMLIILFLAIPLAYADPSTSPRPHKFMVIVEPFHHAVRAGEIERVKGYLTHFPPLVTTKGAGGTTALHLASVFDRRDIAELLITKGADVNAKDDRGNTPLYYAIKRNHQSLADLLRSHGALQ